jgi:protein arginine kinase
MSAAPGSHLPHGVPFEAVPEWLRGDGESADVVVSSRARLARNLAGHTFPARSNQQQRNTTLKLCKDWLSKAGLCPQTTCIALHQAPSSERTLLVERHLISKPLAKGRPLPDTDDQERPPSESDPRAVVVGLPDEKLAVMINEEDHLRIQAISSGLDLRAVLTRAIAADDRIEAGLDYAFDEQFGYLTACPTNVGTGLRLSCMVHLPALKMTGELEKVKRAAADMNLAVRGFYGEGSDAIGDLFQVSNQTALGKSEDQILHELDGEIIPRIVEYERFARKTLISKRRTVVEDQVWRAFGALTRARLMGAEEAMQLLSQVRLGVSLGLIRDTTVRVVNHLMLLVQPAHLQRVVGHEMDQDHRKEARATLLRTRLGG